VMATVRAASPTKNSVPPQFRHGFDCVFIFGKCAAA
jgi:hypothetical protein